MRESVAGFVGQLRRSWRGRVRRRKSLGNGSAAWIEPAFGRIGSTSFSGQIETLEDRVLLLAAGSLDPTFGIGGIAPAKINGSTVASQSDGKIVVVGNTSATPLQLRLARYNADGTSDVTFGNDGTITNDLAPTGFQLACVALQSDGKIIVGGRTSFPALARFNVDGSLDTTFGIDGQVTMNFGPLAHSSSQARSIELQSDGKIIVGVDYDVLARFNIDGRLDTTFGEAGWLRTNRESGFGSSITGLALQSDGKIIAVGNGNGFTTSRYNPDGSFDTTFGNDGWVSTAFGYDANYVFEFPTDVAIQSDGKVVVVGFGVYGSGPHNSLLLARYNIDGSLDSSFGIDGRVTANSDAEGCGVILQSDDRIIVGRFGSAPLLARYNSNGRLDSTFGIGGLVTANDLFGEGIALQGNDKVVVVGNRQGNGPFGPVLARFNLGAVSGLILVAEGGAASITSTELPSPTFGGSLRTIIYTIADAPNHGKLRLNSTTLRVGSTFTQADINAGRLSYRHDGSETTSDSFDYTVRGPNRASLPRQTFSIFVAPVNDPPTLDSVSANVMFAENAAPLLFARSATITDPDSSNFNGGELTFSISRDWTVVDGYLDIASIGTSNGQVEVSGQSVRFTSGGVTREIGEFFPIPSRDGLGDSLISTSVSAIRFNSLATRDSVQAVLRNIRFQDDSDNPSPLPRTVTITLTDGDGGTSNILRTQIRVTPVDDRPRLEQFTSLINAVVAEPARRLMPQATMLDPDLKRLDGATLVVRGSPTASIVPGDGVWLASATSTIRVDNRIVATVSHSGFQMSVRFNRNATSDDVTRVLRRVAVEASSTPGRRRTTDVWFTDPNRVRSNVAHLTIQSIARTTATTEEVASHLHSQQITGVTVITHGFQLTEDGDALHPLARAIWEREDATNGDDAAWFLDEDVNGPNGQYVFDTSPFDGQPVLPAIGTANQRGEVVLLFDWAADSNNSGPGYGEANGQRLFQMLVELGLVDPAQGAANSIPLHFIGHSFGAAVTSEAIERLAYYGVPIDQVTYLDPHDFNQGLGFDGAQQLFTLGQPQFADGSQGYGATVWNNVAFADVYYETRPRSLIPNGRPILGAYNQLLNQRVGGVNPHSRVWDDFYLNTVIDVNGLSSDTTNLGGYAYSRIAAGESQRPAPRFFDVSQDHRFTSRHLVAFNFVGQPIQINGHFVPGDQAPIAGDEAPLASIRFAPLWQPT